MKHRRRDLERLIRIIFNAGELPLYFNYQHKSTVLSKPPKREDPLLARPSFLESCCEPAKPVINTIETSLYTTRISRIVSTVTNTLETQENHPLNLVQSVAMSSKINLNTVNVFSADGERVTNMMRRIIKYSNTEQKLFHWFNWFRNHVPNSCKRSWDLNVKHLITRELGRAEWSAHAATELRAKVDADIETFRIKHCNTTVSLRHQLVPIETFARDLQKNAKLDDVIKYADTIRQGYETAAILGEIIETLWHHHVKQLVVLRDTSGNAQLSKLDQLDRALDFTRYMQARARWLAIEKAQAGLKARLDG